MALIPDTAFPDQVTPPSAEYPLGSAKDIAFAGDTSGTPFNALLVDDAFGFQQALLAQAGITASGVADTSLESQYFDAMAFVLGRVFTDVSAMVAKPILSGQKAFVMGNQTAGDGGSAFYIGRTPAEFGGAADGIGDHTCSNGNIADLQVDGQETRILQYGAVAGADITPEAKAAQAKLVTRGGGRLLFDLKGFATLADLTATANFADFALNVESGIELTAIPDFEIRADKTKGTDNGGYCIFHILEDKKNIKIHGFKNINGIDKDTVKGIGQVVAIRGETGVTKATNIDIWDITATQIRDEPFRLGQTSFSGQIGKNVNIWDIRINGCISHGIVMRSMLDSSASNLNIEDTGLLGIDISSFCVNTHLHGGRGHNRFFNTTGGAKVDGSQNNIDCSIGDYTYDGNVNGDASVNGYAFRLMGLRARAHNIFAENCGGSGINSLSGGAADDELNMEWENILIEGVSNGDGSSSTFNGKAMVAKHDSVGELGITSTNVEIRNAFVTGQLDVNGFKGDLKLVSNSIATFNNNSTGKTKNMRIDISLVDATHVIVSDGTNGGSDNVSWFIKEMTGNSQLDIRSSSRVAVSGDAVLESTNTRQIVLDNCNDFHVHGMTGNGISMVWIEGTMARGIVTDLTGDYSSGLIFETTVVYTANKGLYANCVNSGIGGYQTPSVTSTQTNLL